MTSLEGFSQSLERCQPAFEIAIADVERSRIITMAIQEMIFKINIYRKIMWSWSLIFCVILRKIANFQEY